MKEKSYGQLFAKNLVMALPWGIIFLVVFSIASASIMQQIKESLKVTANTAISETGNFVKDSPRFTPIKHEIKKAVKFATKTAKDELMDLLNDPELKKNLKEIFEYIIEKQGE